MRNMVVLGNSIFLILDLDLDFSQDMKGDKSHVNSLFANRTCIKMVCFHSLKIGPIFYFSI